MTALRFTVAALVLLVGCDKNGDTSADDLPPQIEYLEPTEHLLRASMAIRGVRPTVEELAAVRADPSQLEPLVDAYLDSPEFGAMVRDLHAELLLLRTDTTFQLPVYGPLVEKGFSQADVHFSTVEAPLRFVEDIVVNDRPYTEVVTAQYTYANDVVAAIYGLPYDPNGPEWQYTNWTDGRPHAGLLSDSEVWRRHTSNAQNFHRGRANVVSKVFLCEDIASRDVVIEGGVNIADPLVVAEAVKNNPTCIGCHDILDPLAGYFWGYKEQLKRGAINKAYEANCDWDFDTFDGALPAFGSDPLRDSYRIDHWCYPLRFYVVSDETLWQTYNLKPPSYFGQPAEDLTDVGFHIAEDPRFAQCTVRNFYSYLGQVDREDVPLEIASELQERLVASDFDIKQLVRDIVLSDPFRTRRVLSDEQGEVFAPGLQAVRPEQFSRMVHDLTGFIWVADQDRVGCTAGGNTCWKTIDIATTDLYGFRSMMGGIDGYTVTHPTHTATPTKLLAMSQMADEAAGFVVMSDFLSPASERRLLHLVEPTTVDEPAIREQLAYLHARISGELVAPDGAEVDSTYELFTLGASGGEPSDGWRLVISALLQDVRTMYY